MAVTKIKPIHSTLNAALDYITNKNKTCDSILIDSYGCSYMTAASEFSLTRSLNKSTVKGKKDVIAYHVIQSFKPDEIDYNLAHALGKEFAKKLTGGNFEYIIATHVDKNHIHNHIIFNSVSFCDHKKYHSNRQSYFNLRKLSDSLCMEYGLSVIENPQSKGQKYLQWMNKDRSFKTALRHNIDALLPFVASFEELLNSLKLQGYEIKETDNMLSFKAPVSNRFTRLSSLGPKYCKENLSLTIKHGLVSPIAPLRPNLRLRLAPTITSTFFPSKFRLLMILYSSIFASLKASIASCVLIYCLCLSSSSLIAFLYCFLA